MQRALLLLLFVLTTLSITAQVGVNRTNPQQALDVNGKIRVGNDGAAPDAGTIRFDAATGQFEGFDGTEWKNLGEEKSGALPEGPVPILGVGFASTNQSSSGVTFYRFEDRSSFSQVPAGKFLIVTSVNIGPNGIVVSENRNYYVQISPSFLNSGFGSSIFGMTFTGNHGETKHVEAGQAPLLVLRAGEFLRMYQDNRVDNPVGLDIEIRGFLVDSLTY